MKPNPLNQAVQALTNSPRMSEWKNAGLGTLANVPHEPIVLAGLWFHTDATRIKQGIALAMRPTTHSALDHWVGLVAMLLPPFPTDVTVLLNLLSMLAPESCWSPQVLSSLVPERVAPFIAHALDQPPIVAERAVDLLGVIPPAVVASAHSAVVAGMFDNAHRVASAIDDTLIREALVGIVADARAAASRAKATPRTSTAVLRGVLQAATESVEAGSARQVAQLAFERLDAYLTDSTATG